MKAVLAKDKAEVLAKTQLVLYHSATQGWLEGCNMRRKARGDDT